jgi:hypothetical protein
MDLTRQRQQLSSEVEKFEATVALIPVSLVTSRVSTLEYKLVRFAGKEEGRFGYGSLFFPWLCRSFHRAHRAPPGHEKAYSTGEGSEDRYDSEDSDGLNERAKYLLVDATTGVGWVRLAKSASPGC